MWNNYFTWLNGEIQLPDEYTLYTVLNGDTLETISQKFDTTVSDIKLLNNMVSDSIYEGSTLKIPVGKKEEPKEPDNPDDPKTPDSPEKPNKPSSDNNKKEPKQPDNPEKPILPEGITEKTVNKKTSITPNDEDFDTELGKLKKGDKVIVLGVLGKYTKINYKGIIGYVPTKNLI